MRAAASLILAAALLGACDRPAAEAPEAAPPEDLAAPWADLPPVATGPMASQGGGLPVDEELAAERELQMTLPRADHPLWRTLSATRIWIDEPTQLYRAAHPPEVRRLDGRRVTLRGYMLPLEATTRTRHFLISPYTPVCLFHPPAEPNEVVEVRLSRPIEAGYHLVEVTGRLRLADNGEKGLFFVLDRASARIAQRIE